MDLLAEPGTLLAAWPDLQDPNFMHTVVMMVRHEAEGAFGLVLNRSTGLTTRQLLPDHPVLERLALPVLLGGPVDHKVLHIVHALPDELPGGMPIHGRLMCGADLEALARLAAEDAGRVRRYVRMYLGYSGWGAGQLEAELSMGSWLPAPLSLEAVFHDDARGVWKQVIRSLGRDAQGLELEPPDVSWN